MQTLFGSAGVPAGWGQRAAAPAKATEIREPAMVEVGTTGTGIFGQGYIRELGEYNSLFSGGPFSSYRTFETMRRSDAQVAATVMAMKLPVRCAEWMIQPPEDATPVEEECAEFVESCLFDDIDFDRSLENLLLAVDFGAGCHEDVWTITNGQVRLAKLAARMPLTFYTWTVNPETEDLMELVQHGFHLGQFGEYRLPADKICLYSFRQEGSNFAGRAILREMYQHWYTKAALYKIDAIACERNGMGVPVGTLADGAKAEDKTTFENFLKRVAAHQSVYVMMPSGYGFDLKGVTGQLRDPKESIQHHNMQISMAGLAQFMIMGQQSKGSGNRSLGETMSDFFYLSLQTLANQVGDAYSDTTIRRLAAYNYEPKVRPPRLVPQRIIAMKFELIIDALARLGTANMLTPDPDMEVWIRKEMGAPAKEAAEIARMRERTVTTGPAASAAGDRGPGAGEVKNAADKGAGGAQETDKAAQKPAKRVAASEMSPPMRREPGSLERMSERGRAAERCLVLSEMVSALDQGRDDIAVALRAARSRVQAEIVHKLVGRPVREMHRVSIAPDQKLIDEVQAILERVYEFGGSTVEQERARQQEGKTPADAAVIQASGRKPKRDPLGVYADGVVGEFQNTLTSRAANVAIDWTRRPAGETQGEVIRGIEEDLDGQSDKWIDGVASKGANEAFADGRADGYAEHKDEIQAVVYSALLDINTCEACAAADGEEGATPEDIPDVPNPDCDGGDRCRCVHVYVFSDEVRQ